MIECAILAIGEELLEGSVADTNSSYIARRLAAIDIMPGMITLLPDDMEVIARYVLEMMEQYPLVITTGGLGPTFDDLTIASIAGALGRRLVKDGYAEKHIIRRMKTLQLDVSESQLRQAFFPEGAEIIPNPNGTACAMRITAGGCTIISLPGVPHEMQAILEDDVLPYLERAFALKKPYRADLHFIGLPEHYVDNVIREVGVPRGVRCIINASMSKVTVKIRAERKELATPLVEKLKSSLKGNYVGDSDGGIARIAVDLLKEKGLTLSVAESCTGGLLGGEITDVAGASAVFMGGVIAYDNRIKMDLLDVPADILARHGAVSEECAVAMMNGIKKRMGTSCAIAVTGIAGPGGGTKEKPVGTVFIASSVGEKINRREFHLSADRWAVRQKAVNQALGMLIALINA